MKKIPKFLFLLIFLIALPLRAEESQTIEIKELGLSLVKPSNWHFLQELNQPLGQDKPQIESLISHYSKKPVVALSKYPAKYNQDLNPNLRITLKPVIGGDKNKTVKSNQPEERLKSLSKNLAGVLAEYKVEEKPHRLNLSGFPAARLRFSYVVNLVKGGKTRGHSDLWYVMPRGDYAFLVSGVTRLDQKNAKRSELEEIVNSIQISALKD